MQYEVIIGRFGSVAIAIATSTISRGKSNCGKLAVAACGNFPKGCTGYLTDSMARGHLSGALPFLYDDPSSDSVLKPLLMNSFGGAEIGTRRSQFSARCTPIITCNEFVIERLSKADDRLAIINDFVCNTSSQMLTIAILCIYSRNNTCINWLAV